MRKDSEPAKIEVTLLPVPAEKKIGIPHVKSEVNEENRQVILIFSESGFEAFKQMAAGHEISGVNIKFK